MKSRHGFIGGYTGTPKFEEYYEDIEEDYYEESLDIDFIIEEEVEQSRIDRLIKLEPKVM